MFRKPFLLKPKNFYFVIWAWVAYLTISTFSSCKEENVLLLHKEFEIHIPDIVGIDRQYIFDNDTLLFGLRIENNKIYQMNTSLMIEDSIDVNFYPLQSIWDYHFISKDSILLMIHPQYTNNYYDHIMMIVDRHKNILDTINLSKLPVPIKPSFNLKHDTTIQRYYALSFNNFPLTYNKGRIIAPISLYNSKNIERIKHPEPIQIIHHFQNDSISKTPISFSFYKDGLSYSYNHQRPIGTMSDSILYVAYGYEPMVYAYNMETNTLFQKYIPFTTIDSIKPYPIKSFYDIQKGHLLTAYKKMHYNAYDETILWLAQLGADSTESPLSRENPIITFVLCDKHLNKLAEGILPKEYRYYTFIRPYNNGFLAYKGRKDGEIIYDFFSYTIEKKKSGYLRAEIQKRKQIYNQNFIKKPENEMILSYIEAITKKHINDAKILIIPIQASCQGCLHLFAQSIKENFKKLQAKSLIVILISDKNYITINEYSFTVDNFISQSIPDTIDDTLTRQLFYLDTNKTFLSFVNSWINPRYLECQSSKIIFNKIINPQEFKIFKEKLTTNDSY